jgi:hypothetical protein
MFFVTIMYLSFYGLAGVVDLWCWGTMGSKEATPVLVLMVKLHAKQLDSQEK